MGKTLVSIVMPVHNSEKFLEKAITSIQKQTYPNWELLAVNDASEDSSLEILAASAKKDPRIKVLNNKKNMGIAQTRNAGIKKASGEYIAFLDSDDQWLPEKLEKQLNIMNENEIDFSCSSYFVADEEGNKIGERVFKQGYQNYSELLKTNNIGCLTVLIKADLIKKAQMPDVKHEDYATWLNIVKSGIPVYYIEDKLAVYTKRDNSVSANKLNTISWVWNIFRNELGMSSIKSTLLLSRFLFFTTFKYIK